MIVALLVCLIPTTIGGLLSAIGIAGMDRLIRKNVLAMSGRAVEAAGDVDTLLLDKTGTITLGNRMATEFIPVARRRASRTWPTPPSSPAWPTRRPRAARSSCWPRSSSACAAATSRRSARTFVPFTRPDPHERLRPRRPRDPQGRGGRRRRARRSAGRRPCPSELEAIAGQHRRRGRHAAGRRRRQPRARASSTSRTWSRAASRSASTASAPWASAP